LAEVQDKNMHAFVTYFIPYIIPVFCEQMEGQWKCHSYNAVRFSGEAIQFIPQWPSKISLVGRI